MHVGFCCALTLTMQSLIGLAAEEFDAAPEQAGIFQGKIVEFINDDLVLETSDGDVLRI